MAISSVNYNMMASYGAYNQKLTSATKAKLDELKIAYSPEITEAEGKKLIQKATAEAHNNQQEGSFGQNQNNTSYLYEKAKALAQKLGISAENASFNALLALIESKLEQKIAINKNNEAALKELKSLSQDLASIQAESKGSSGYDNTNQALMESLEMLAQYNKNYLNK